MKLHFGTWCNRIEHRGDGKERKRERVKVTNWKMDSDQHMISTLTHLLWPHYIKMPLSLQVYCDWEVHVMQHY